MKLLKWITSLFSAPSYQDSLDAFVTTKHPHNVAEVEYWIQYFELHNHGGAAK
jgi:hypothetical protein